MLTKVDSNTSCWQTCNVNCALYMKSVALYFLIFLLKSLWDFLRDSPSSHFHAVGDVGLIQCFWLVALPMKIVQVTRIEKPVVKEVPKSEDSNDDDWLPSPPKLAKVVGLFSGDSTLQQLRWDFCWRFSYPLNFCFRVFYFPSQFLLLSHLLFANRMVTFDCHLSSILHNFLIAWHMLSHGQKVDA